MSAPVRKRESTWAMELYMPNVLVSSSERIMEGTFGIVTQSLMKLGTCPIEHLARSPKADLEGFDLLDISSDFELLRPTSKPSPEPGLMVSDDKESLKVPSSMQFVALLHQTCVGAFGNSEALKFEFLEETGQGDKKQCILTITRPNGQIRSYTTAAEFSRKSDAKARAAAIAVEMGAVDFILHGNKDALGSKIILAPLDASTAGNQIGKIKEGTPITDSIEDEASDQVEKLCLEWRAGQVRPHWVFFKEHKAAHSWGCVLVIELSPHSQRLYSVEPRYSARPAAKKACTETAIREGVLDFIKYGNGQTAPAPGATNLLDGAFLNREPNIEWKGRTSAISLQSFFESLPKPFPEPFEDKKLISNVNVPGILNTKLQLAKGSRLNLHFYFLYDNGLHGCIIRLERPRETRTYMVETRFMKRSDAKAAVCLKAVSQGVVKYIRSLAADIDNKVTTEMRTLANEQILPILASEYGRLRYGMHPIYKYEHDNGAFGCTMILSLSADAGPEETRSWSVKPEYRTKTDAKIAVVCAAGSEAIEFVRFRGKPAPPDHDPLKPYWHKIKTERPPEANGAVQRDLKAVPLLETKEEALARRKASGKRERSEFVSSRPGRYESGFSRAVSRPTAPASSRHYGPQRRGPPYLKVSYNNRSSSPTNPPASRLYHSYEREPSESPTAHQTQEYSPESVANLRPPRRSQQNPHSLYQASPVNHSLPPYRQHPQQDISEQSSPQDTQSVPSQPPPQSPAFAPYGTTPPLHQVVPAQAWPVPTPPYTQPLPYQYPVPQGTPYPLQPSGYHFPVMPVPPPPPAHATQATPPYATYPAYYADPRYAQYPNPQYGIPAAAVPYTVPPVAPVPGMQYGISPPPPDTTPANSVQMNTTMSPTPPTSDMSASAHRIEIDVSKIRAGSFSSQNDRQKRPRSPRDMSMSPDDVPAEAKPVNKKRRPESLKLDVSKSTKSKAPAPPTPVSVSKDSTSHVKQLLRYCELQKLSSPEFGAKQVKNDRGEDAYKVWIVMGKERLELPVTFSSENEGRQRVAKQVLQRLKSQVG